jgi:hypothetical protein
MSSRAAGAAAWSLASASAQSGVAVLEFYMCAVDESSLRTYARHLGSAFAVRGRDDFELSWVVSSARLEYRELRPRVVGASVERALAAARAAHGDDPHDRLAALAVDRASDAELAELCEALRDNDTIVELMLSRTDVSAEAAQALVRAMPHSAVRVLRFEGCCVAKTDLSAAVVELRARGLTMHASERCGAVTVQFVPDYDIVIG